MNEWMDGQAIGILDKNGTGKRGEEREVGEWTDGNGGLGNAAEIVWQKEDSKSRMAGILSFAFGWKDATHETRGKAQTREMQEMEIGREEGGKTATNVVAAKASAQMKAAMVKLLQCQTMMPMRFLLGNAKK